MSKIKKFVASVLTCVMLAGNSVFVSASTGNSRDFYFNGVRYVITESVDANGNKKVDVVGKGERASVINDGKSLELTTVGKDGTSKCLDISLDNSQSNSKSLLSYSEEQSDLYWNYSYYYNPDARPEMDTLQSLSSGDSNGNWSGWDNNNSEARNYAYDFCSNVCDLRNSQMSATAVSGIFATAIISTIASIGLTAGISAIIAAISVIVSGYEVLSAWTEAYNDSLACNRAFIRFKQALGV